MPSPPSSPSHATAVSQQPRALDRTQRRSANSANSAKLPRPNHPHRRNVVFLVPGLLGFEHFSTFGYFADRVSAALRAGLEQAWGEPVAVVPVPIAPTASLRHRQVGLVNTLASRLAALEAGGAPHHVHLLGHSTGGVDVNLLTCERPIGGGSWVDIDARAPQLLAQLRSVVTLSSPHQGACITRDPVVQLIAKRKLVGLTDVAILFSKLIGSVACDVDFSNFFASSWRESTKLGRFLLQALSDWQLIDDLQPSRPAAVDTFRDDVVRRSIVTIAGVTVDAASPLRPADGFFLDLSQRASGQSTGCSMEGDHVVASLQRLQQALSEPPAAGLLIRNPAATLPQQLTAEHNDGVVNVARQLIDPYDRQELAGIVVGDHFDVLGYYDRTIWTVNQRGEDQERPLLGGLLHSGSGFGDEQFFALYRRIADLIAASANEAS